MLIRTLIILLFLNFSISGNAQPTAPEINSNNHSSQVDCDSCDQSCELCINLAIIKPDFISLTYKKNIFSLNKAKHKYSFLNQPELPPPYSLKN